LLFRTSLLAWLFLAVCAGSASADDRSACENDAQPDDSKIAACTKAIASGAYRDHDLAMLYYARGKTYRNGPHSDLALADDTAAIRLDPTLAIAYHERGKMHAQIADDPAALADFNKAIEVDPKLAIAYVDRAFLHESQGDLSDAQADFHTGHDLDPTNADAATAMKRYARLPLSTRQEYVVLTAFLFADAEDNCHYESHRDRYEWLFHSAGLTDGDMYDLPKTKKLLDEISSVHARFASHKARTCREVWMDYGPHGRFGSFLFQFSMVPSKSR